MMPSSPLSGPGSPETVVGSDEDYAPPCRISPGKRKCPTGEVDPYDPQNDYNEEPLPLKKRRQVPPSRILPEPRKNSRKRPAIEDDAYDPGNDDDEVPAPRAKKRRTVAEMGNDDEDSDQENVEGDIERQEGDRQRHRNARRRDRFVRDIDTALDPSNYHPVPVPEREEKVTVPMTADPINGLPPSTITWTNIPSGQTTRRGAADVVYQRK
jgi:hypothetical protein